MKYILLFIFLFIPSVRASEDALSCSYNINGKTVNFGYYISSDNTPVITSFIVDGESYGYYYNKISNVDSKLDCPTVSSVNFNGDNNSYYFITKNKEQFNMLIADNEIIYDDDGNLIGQINSINDASSKNSTEYKHYSTREINASEGLTNEVRKQMDKNIKAYGIACEYYEKQAITNYFYINDFNSLNNFSADNIFKKDKEYIKLSSECANAAKNLHNSVIAVRHMLSDYVDGGGDQNKLNYLSLQSSFSAGYGSLTTLWVNNTVSENPCDAINEDIRSILNYFFDIFRLVAVILTIFMVYLDGMKCLSKNDDSETKKWISIAGKRLIVLIICLMLPLIVNIILDLINNYMAGSLVEINGECVKKITE